MDHAKSGRVARPVWFDAGMERALIAHSEIEQGIRFGLEHDQFVPYFEPQVDLATGEIIGFEVLARWNHPLSGIIAPDAFIPVAEEIGLIGRLSEQVIARRAAPGASTGTRRSSISVNISPTQLTDSWLAQRIVRLLTETGFPAERLVVEITESSLFADIDLARSIVTSLKNQGIRLALDDFGTGFSSLSHLRSLPFDVIKIDRSFVANIHRDTRKRGDRPRGDDAGQRARRCRCTVEGIERCRDPCRGARLRLRGRPGLVFRQADDRPTRPRNCCADRGRGRRRAAHAALAAELSPLHTTDRPLVPRSGRRDRVAPICGVESMVKTTLRYCRMTHPRSALATDPLPFGRRVRASAPFAALTPSRTSIGDDLRLFAMTFAAASCSCRVFASA